MVDKERFGAKHTCPTCECKFYDFNRKPAICPRCQTDPTAPEEEPEEIEEPEEEIPELDLKDDDSLLESEDDLPEDD